MITLPELARRDGIHPEAVRTFLRRYRPDLIQRGQIIGRARAYDANAAAEIRTAFQNRPKTKT